MFIKRIVVGEMAVNCYLVGCESTGQAALIDPGAEADTILAELALGSWRLEKIILTHAHFDHFGAVIAIEKRAQAPLLIGKADAATLSDPALSLAESLGGGRQTLKADTLLEDGQFIALGDLQLEVLHTPGHTPGGICLLAEEVLFTGDTIFAGSCGRTDFPGGSASRLRESLCRLSQLPGTLKVLPGHGPDSTMSRELTVNPYLG